MLHQFDNCLFASCVYPFTREIGLMSRPPQRGAEIRWSPLPRSLSPPPGLVRRRKSSRSASPDPESSDPTSLSFSLSDLPLPIYHPDADVAPPPDDQHWYEMLVLILSNGGQHGPGEGRAQVPSCILSITDSSMPPPKGTNQPGLLLNIWGRTECTMK